MNLTYLRYELLRTVRNKRAFVFSLSVPADLLLPDRGLEQERDARWRPLRDVLPRRYGVVRHDGGNDFARREDRRRASVGWNRQLRLTPLSTRDYMRAKVLSGYLTALLTLALLFLAGATLGVHLNADRVLHMTLLVLVGLIPFAALGILDRAPVHTRLDGPGHRWWRFDPRVPRRCVGSGRR